MATSALESPQITTQSSRIPMVPLVSKWRPVRFALRYRAQVREVIVLAPFPEYAIHGVGNSSDEDVSPRPLDPLSESLALATSRTSPTGYELEQFYTEMERCLRAGLSESQALKLVSPLCKTPYFRGVMSGLRYLMERHGQKLGDAMAQFPGAFDEIAVTLVHAGATAGKQDSVFLRLSKRAAASRGLVGKFYAALLTPAITLLFIAAGSIVLAVGVFPILESNFKAMHFGSGVLPLPTRIVLGSSVFLREHIWLLMLPIGAAFWAFVQRAKIAASPLYQRSAVRVPFVGTAYRLVIMSRSLDALALLNAEAVPLERCYHLAAKIAGQYEYSAFFLAVHGHIARGRKPFSAFLAERHLIGPEGADLAARMEAASVVGEVSESLQITAKIMQEVAESKVDTLPKLIGPLITVVSTGAVILLALAVFLPTLSLLMDALHFGRNGGGGR